jgi:hypothetical protein
VRSQVHTRIWAKLVYKPGADMLLMEYDDRVVLRGLKNENRMGGRGLEECERRDGWVQFRRCNPECELLVLDAVSA